MQHLIQCLNRYDIELLDEIVNYVSVHTNISVEEIMRKHSRNEYTRARYIAAYIARMTTKYSLHQLGRYFGFNHTMINAAKNSIESVIFPINGVIQDIEAANIVRLGINMFGKTKLAYPKVTGLHALLSPTQS